MILGVLADVGADLGAIATQVQAVLHDEFHVDIKKVTEAGIAGTRVTVEAHEHHHDEKPKLKPRRRRHKPQHHHRNLADILALLEHAPQAEAARLAAEVFRTLAAAEAAVHGTTPDEVHFHEVGAVDAIVDIYGSCLALVQLGVTEVAVSPLPEGHGTIACAHGIMPIPAPATAELLKGHPVMRVDEPFELVTPTGAALLMTWKRLFPASASATVPVQNGVGFGQRKLKNRPNLLRAMLSERSKVEGEKVEGEHGVSSTFDLQPSTSGLVQLETNIDDATPEVLAYTMECLFEARALDVWFTPIIMKKGRPATQLSVLCHASKASAMEQIIFAETPTLGIRRLYVERTTLERTCEPVQTPYGPINVKKTLHGTKPEYGDCSRIARKHNLPLRIVQRFV